MENYPFSPSYLEHLMNFHPSLKKTVCRSSTVLLTVASNSHAILVLLSKSSVMKSFLHFTGKSLRDATS